MDQATGTTRVPFPQDRKEFYNDVSKDASSPVFKRVIPTTREFGPQMAVTAATKAGMKDNPAMSFVMLTDSQVVPPQHTPITPEGSHTEVPTRKEINSESNPFQDPQQSLSHQIESTTRLFEILSSHSDIDHPICSECTEILLAQLQSRLVASNKERDAYISFLKTLNNTIPAPAEIWKAQSSLAISKAAEAKAFAELVAIEKEKAVLDDEIAGLEAESLALDEEEQAFWRSRNAFALTLSSFQDDRDALNAAYDHDAQHLERLQRTNVYNDTFCIGHDGFFGTINGLRLGRLSPPQNVDWSEINAAWGTAALLLATVAEKLGFIFRGYRIRPLGSTSKIEKYDNTATATQQTSASSTQSTVPDSESQQRHSPKVTSLDLFSSGDLPLGRMLIHRRLDAGMVAFLECLRQLGEYVEKTSAAGSSSHTTSPSAATQATDATGRKSPASGTGGLKLPYIIRKDKIGPESIRLGVSSDEAWTRACKYALTCCKFLLAHASNVGGEERRRTG